MPSIIVIYDGQCEFCKICINWVQKRLDIEPIAFQEAALEKYQLSRAECETQVFVIESGQKYGAASAVIVLLDRRGNQILAKFLKLLGPVGSWGYFQVANHRGSLWVRAFGKFLTFLT